MRSKPSELARFRDLVKRRRKGEPVAYLRGEKEFYGRTFHIDKRVLVPRPDTEIFVETALRRTSSSSMARALSRSLHRLGLRSDLDGARAAELASVRGRSLARCHRGRARELDTTRRGAPDRVVGRRSLPTFGVGSRRKFDLITANPPYIAEGDFPGLSVDIRDFEPRMALTGGADGLDVTKRIVAEAPRYLRPGGVLALEMGTVRLSA